MQEMILTFLNAFITRTNGTYGFKVMLILMFVERDGSNRCTEQPRYFLSNSDN